MEIFTGREGEIVLKKYSPIEELGNLAKEYVQAMAQTLGCPVCICDHDQIVAAGGVRQQEYQGKMISKELEAAIMDRKSICARGGERENIPIFQGAEKNLPQVIVPILSAGDAIGAVIISGKTADAQMGEMEKKLAQVAAGYLGMQMEQ